MRRLLTPVQRLKCDVKQAKTILSCLIYLWTQSQLISYLPAISYYFCLKAKIFLISRYTNLQPQIVFEILLNGKKRNISRLQKVFDYYALQFRYAMQISSDCLPQEVIDLDRFVRRVVPNQ